MSHSNIVSLYLLVVELTAVLMGTRLLALLRTSQTLHPVEIMSVIAGLWRFRPFYRCGIPYKSLPVLFLITSLVFRFSSELRSVTLLSIVSSGFVVPLYEELLYRVVIPCMVERRLGRILSGRILFSAIVLISNILFTFAHRSTLGSNSDMLICFVSGLALSSTYMSSGNNMIEPLAIHMLHNLHALLVRDINGTFVVPLFFYAAIFLTNTGRIAMERYR